MPNLRLLPVEEAAASDDLSSVVDREQRLLRRVLGEIPVAQDPARDREEPIGDRAGKEAICRLVTALSSLDQIGVHLTPADGGGFVRRLSHGRSQSPGDLVNLRERRRQGQALPAFGHRFSLRTELDGPLDRVQAG